MIASAKGLDDVAAEVCGKKLSKGDMKMATETEAIYRQRSSPSLTHRNLERCVRAGKLLIAASALNSIPERKHEGQYLSFGNLLPELLLAIVILAGCVEMPV